MAAPVLTGAVMDTGNGISPGVDYPLTGINTPANGMSLNLWVFDAEQDFIVKDNKGNTANWAKIGTTQSSGANHKVSRWRVPASVALGGTGHVVTLNWNSAPNYGAAYPTVVWGYIPDGELDKSNQGSATGGSPSINSNGTLAQADENVIVGITTVGGGDITSSDGTQVLENQDDSTYWSGAVFRKTVASTAQASISFSVPSALNTAMSLDTYYTAAPAGTTVASPLATTSYAARAPQARARVAPAAATHTYSGRVPQLRARVSPGAATHTYSGRVPQVRAKVAPAQVSHSYTGRVPQFPSKVLGLVTSHTYAARVPAAASKVAGPVATHTYSGRAPQVRARVAPGTATHTYSGRVPTMLMGFGVGVPVMQHSYLGRAAAAAARVAPAAATHTYSGRVPVALVGSGVAPPAALQSYVARVPQAKARIAAGFAAHTYSGRTPTAIVGAGVAPPAASHTYSGRAPQARSKVAAGVAVHTYSARTPQAQLRIAIGVASHTYSARVPSAKMKVAVGVAGHVYAFLAPFLGEPPIVTTPLTIHRFVVRDWPVSFAAGERYMHFVVPDRTLHFEAP